MQMKRLCLVSIVALQLVGGVAAAQTVMLKDKKPDLRTAPAGDPEIAALKAQVEALTARLNEDEKKLAAASLLLSGLDKSVGTLRTDFENHFHPLNADAVVATDQLYVQVDGKNYNLHNPYGKRLLLSAPFVPTNPKPDLRPNATQKAVHGQ